MLNALASTQIYDKIMSDDEHNVDAHILLFIFLLHFLERIGFFSSEKVCSNIVLYEYCI